SLAMARKAGAVVTGFTKVEAAIRTGAIGLLHAVEAADDGARKLDGPFRARAGQEAPVLRMFTADQLGLALGGPHVIHAALLAGRPSEVVLERVAELVRYDCQD